MSTDSGVSDLIRSFQTRRLDTDPGDAILFQPPKEPVRAVTPRHSLDRAPLVAPRMAAPVSIPAPARSLDRSAARASLTLAPARSLDRSSRTPAPVYPRASRDVVWPWIAATLIAGVLGLFGASYVWRTVEGDEASVSPESVAPPAPVIAPFVAPSVEPAPPPVAAAPAAAAASPASTDANAIVPPIASPSADSAASTTPHKKAHRRGHAKAKRINAKHAKTSSR